MIDYTFDINLKDTPVGKDRHFGIFSWLLGKAHYEFSDRGVLHTIYTGIFFIDWLIKFNDYVVKGMKTLTSSRSFFNWNDVPEYAVYEDKRAILVKYKVTGFIQKPAWIYCTSENFKQVQDIFRKKVAGKKVAQIRLYGVVSSPKK